MILENTRIPLPILQDVNLSFLHAADAKVVITATESVIGDQLLNLKKNVDEALTLLHEANANSVKHIVVSTGSANNDSGVEIEKDIHLEKVR